MYGCGSLDKNCCSLIIQINSVDSSLRSFPCVWETASAQTEAEMSRFYVENGGEQKRDDYKQQQPTDEKYNCIGEESKSEKGTGNFCRGGQKDV